MSASTDESTRFCLPESAPYLANLAALWAVDARLAAKIEALGDECVYPLVASRAGPSTVVVNAPDGKKLFLHSRYEPLEEARRLVEGIATEERFAFCLYGFGLGYHAELLFERASTESIFCVFEPDLRLLRTALRQRDLSRLIASRRFLFFTELDKGDLLRRLIPHAALISIGVEAVEHPVSQQAQPEFHGQMRAWIDEPARQRRSENISEQREAA